MPQEENQSYQTQQYGLVEQPEVSVVDAWKVATQQTWQFIKTHMNFPLFPIITGLTVGFFARSSLKDGDFVPYFLVCGMGAVIAKQVPYAVFPIVCSFTLFKR